MAVDFEQQRVIQFDIKMLKTLEHQLFLTYDYGLVLRRKNALVETSESIFCDMAGYNKIVN